MMYHNLGPTSHAASSAHNWREEWAKGGSSQLILGHQQMYDLERFYGTKDGFYKGTDSYKSYKLVQTSNFSLRLMP